MAIAGHGPWRRAFRATGVAPAIEHDGTWPDFATVVDIGAHRGQFSLFARRRWPAARVYAFEPQAAPAADFERIFGGDAKVRLFPLAVAPITGESDMHLATASDSSSLLPIGDEQARLFGTTAGGTARVRLAPLDTSLTAQDVVVPALLKIDVQGSELDVLKGCESLLGRFSALYVECSWVELYAGQALADQVIAWLAGRDFRLSDTRNLSHDGDGRPVQADLLFSRVSDG